MTTLRTGTAIIGGGLMGCWAALMLRRRNEPVVVLERGSVGAQASGVNFGNLRLQGRHPRQFPLALRAHALWERFEEITGESCEVEATGHLLCARDEAGQIAKVETAAREAAAHGVETELLGGNELRRRVPWLEGFVLASFSRRDAVANPRLAGPAVARAAGAAGAELLEGARVVAAERAGVTFRIVTDNGLVVEADRLINTAGAWATEVAGWFGEGAPVVAAGPPQFVTEPLPRLIGPSVQAADGSVIFRQVRQGHIVVSGYPRGAADPVALRAPVDPRRTLATMRHLVAAVPQLGGARLLRVWSGIEGYLPDMLPVLGPSATTPGLFHAFGFCGHGFQLAPGVGAVLAELALDGATATPIDAFLICRFSDGTVDMSEQFRREFDPALLPRAAQP